VTDAGIEHRILQLERQLRVLRFALTALLLTFGTSVLIGANCGGSSKSVVADDIRVKRLFAEKVFVIDSQTDASGAQHVGALMAMEGGNTNLVFYDPEGQPNVRLGFSPEIQGLTLVNRQQNSDVFMGRLNGAPVIAVFAPNGEAAARMTTTTGGGVMQLFDFAGNIRVAAGVIDEDAIIGVADTEGNQLAHLP